MLVEIDNEVVPAPRHPVFWRDLNLCAVFKRERFDAINNALSLEQVSCRRLPLSSETLLSRRSSKHLSNSASCESKLLC